jgi:hypothetical protein
MLIEMGRLDDEICESDPVPNFHGNKIDPLLEAVGQAEKTYTKIIARN